VHFGPAKAKPSAGHKYNNGPGDKWKYSNIARTSHAYSANTAPSCLVIAR